MSRANNFCSWMHDEQLKLYHAMGLDDYEVCERWFTEHEKRFSADQIRKARNRLRLPVNKRLPFTQPELPRKPYEETPNPIETAHAWLGSRLSIRDGDYFLDGKRHGLNAVMQETNRTRMRHGQRQITNHPLWVVP